MSVRADQSLAVAVHPPERGPEFAGGRVSLEAFVARSRKEGGTVEAPGSALLDTRREGVAGSSDLDIIDSECISNGLTLYRL